MNISKRDLIVIRGVVLAVSVLTWILLLYNPGHIMTIEHCHVSASGPSAKSLKMLLDMNPFANQLLGWGLMVVAMMLPKLIIPIEYISACSLKRNRLVLCLLFVFGYIGIWLLAGVFLIALIIGFNLWMPLSFVPAIIVGLIALVWQFSPVKQYSLNQGHDHWNLPAFGWPAMRSSLLFGGMHGVWCIGAGWALMLFPMLLPRGHNMAMIAVTFIMLSEHLEHPKAPRWRMAWRAKLFRIASAQTEMAIKRLRSPGRSFKEQAV
jgi:predicted metal-binding membrane protein